MHPSCLWLGGYVTWSRAFSGEQRQMYGVHYLAAGMTAGPGWQAAGLPRLRKMKALHYFGKALFAPLLLSCSEESIMAQIPM